VRRVRYAYRKKWMDGVVFHPTLSLMKSRRKTVDVVHEREREKT
jgi:hypothetical protein